MSVGGHRHERIAEEILHEVGAMLEGELKDPRLSGAVSVSEVRLSADLRQARVYVVIAGSAEEQASTIRALEASSGYVRHELVERLQMRRAPEIHFVADTSESYGERIDELLRQARKPDE